MVASIHLSLVPVYHRFARQSCGHSGQLVQFIASYIVRKLLRKHDGYHPIKPEI